VIVEAAIRPSGSDLVAKCRLIGSRLLPNQPEPQTTTHFTARVRLTKSSPEISRGTAPLLEAAPVVEAADIYRLYFHGPAYQVLERAWWDGNRMVGLMKKRLPPNHHPPELPTLLAPRLIELCFQTAGIWEMGTLGRMGLPHHIDCVSCALKAADPTDVRLYAVVTPDPTKGSFDAEVVDMQGNRYLQLSGYRTVAMPAAVNEEKLKMLQAVMSLDPVAA
jgi:hypothetical protein